ncbi:hypothetical protein [Streptomyces bacillaris]
MSNDELGKHADPAAVLQSWLDSPATGEIVSRSEIYRAVIKSRHHTPEHLLQIPADEVLSRNEPEIALQTLLDRCGKSADWWAALAAAMIFAYGEEKITFGELLDSLDHAPCARANADILTDYCVTRATSPAFAHLPHTATEGRNPYGGSLGRTCCWAAASARSSWVIGSTQSRLRVVSQSATSARFLPADASRPL